GDGKRIAKGLYPIGLERSEFESSSSHLLTRHISPFQSSGSGLTERKISMCHLPPPQGSMTSAATTSTRISENNRPSGSPSRWYAGSSHPNVGYSINVRNKSYPSSTPIS